MSDKKKLESTNTSVDTKTTENPDNAEIKSIPDLNVIETNKELSHELENEYYDEDEFDTSVESLTLIEESKNIFILEETDNLVVTESIHERIYNEGTTVKTITTTTVEKYDDGSSSTKTQVQTITERKQLVTKGEDGKATPIDPNATKNAPKVDVTTDEKFLQDALKSHNDLRAKHGAPPLTLNKELCKVSQAWANKIADQGSMQHSSSGFGENCFWGSHDVSDGKVPVEHWYNEIKDFKWTKIDHQKGTGHFTQVVWKSSKELGIAKAKGKDGSTYVVANYDPPGNFIGHYPDNIGKLKK